MIDCNGCYIDKLHEFDDERSRCLYRRICERAYKQGRLDAIEEFFKMLESVSFGKRKGLVHWKDIVSIREQLKEHK